MKRRILITGASGTVGLEVLRHLHHLAGEHVLYAGLRNPADHQKKFAHLPKVEPVGFDFEDPASFPLALAGIDTLFLLRPPQLSKVQKYFVPLVQALQQQGVQQVLFLSVQGAEKSPLIPHYKIEKLLLQAGVQYIFLRPSYFMQNLGSTLLPEIRQRSRLFVPAGQALFNWVDVANIGEAAALLLLKFDTYANQAYELTGPESLSFGEVAKKMNQALGTAIYFENPNLLRFYLHMRRQGMSRGMTLVMIMLHYLPRFQPAPPLSSFYQMLTGKRPTRLEDYLLREKALFLS